MSFQVLTLLNIEFRIVHFVLFFPLLLIVNVCITEQSSQYNHSRRRPSIGYWSLTSADTGVGSSSSSSHSQSRSDLRTSERCQSNERRHNRQRRYSTSPSSNVTDDGSSLLRGVLTSDCSCHQPSTRQGPASLPRLDDMLPHIALWTRSAAKEVIQSHLPRYRSNTWYRSPVNGRTQSPTLASSMPSQRRRYSTVIPRSTAAVDSMGLDPLSANGFLHGRIGEAIMPPQHEMPSRFSPPNRRRKVDDAPAQQSVNSESEQSRFGYLHDVSVSWPLPAKRSKLSDENYRMMSRRSTHRRVASASAGSESILKRLLLGVRIVEFNNRYSTNDDNVRKGDLVKRRHQFVGVDVTFAGDSMTSQMRNSETRNWPIAERSMSAMKSSKVSENHREASRGAPRVPSGSRSLVETHFQRPNELRHDAGNWPLKMDQHRRRSTTVRCELAHNITTATASLNKQLCEAQTVAKFDNLTVGCNPATVVSQSRTVLDNNEKSVGRCCQSAYCNFSAAAGEGTVSGIDAATFVFKSSNRSASFNIVGSAAAEGASVATTGHLSSPSSSRRKCILTDAECWSKSTQIVNWLDEIANFATAYRIFAGLSDADHVTLLQRARCRLLLLFMAEANFRLRAGSAECSSDSLESERHGSGSSSSAAAARKSVSEIQMFIDRCRMLDINCKEYHCMRLIALFHSGTIFNNFSMQDLIVI